MRIRSHRELLDDAFWLNPSLREMSKHLFRDIFRRPVRGGNLNCVILALVVAHCPHVRSDLTVLELHAPCETYVSQSKVGIPEEQSQDSVSHVYPTSLSYPACGR